MLLKKVNIINIPSNEDNRGMLSAIEQLTDIPFNIRRIFYLHKIKKNRGGHALKNTDELLIAVSGSFRIKLFDGTKTKTFLMNDPTKGLYIPRLVFLDMFDFTKNTVCLVLANRKYNTNEYLRTPNDFLSYINKKGAKNKSCI